MSFTIRYNNYYELLAILEKWPEITDYVNRGLNPCLILPLDDSQVTIHK